mmetsp:Transcript_111153/g.346415  ORF Transcript_111153/g.346415 Transcript_111153/m.346415 type:complete len:407 (+) Transcript_111153:262-1482(+)
MHHCKDQEDRRADTTGSMKHHSRLCDLHDIEEPVAPVLCDLRRSQVHGRAKDGWTTLAQKALVREPGCDVCQALEVLQSEEGIYHGRHERASNPHAGPDYDGTDSEEDREHRRGPKGRQDDHASTPVLNMHQRLEVPVQRQHPRGQRLPVHGLRLGDGRGRGLRPQELPEGLRVRRPGAQRLPRVGHVRQHGQHRIVEETVHYLHQAVLEVVGDGADRRVQKEGQEEEGSSDRARAIPHGEGNRTAHVNARPLQVGLEWGVRLPQRIDVDVCEVLHQRLQLRGARQLLDEDRLHRVHQPSAGEDHDEAAQLLLLRKVAEEFALPVGGVHAVVQQANAEDDVHQADGDVRIRHVGQEGEGREGVLHVHAGRAVQQRDLAPVIILRRWGGRHRASGVAGWRSALQSTG